MLSSSQPSPKAPREQSVVQTLHKLSMVLWGNITLNGSLVVLT